MVDEHDRPAAADVDLDRDLFFRRIIRELTATLEEVVGTDDAAGFVSVVGGRIGEQIDRSYRRALEVERLSADAVPNVLTDLKARIGGDFYVIEANADRIVLGNRRCPFGDLVEGRESLCMMTSNVFGKIAAGSAGYARVVIDEAIARGDAGCRVVIHLRSSDAAAADDGVEYFDDGDW